MPITYCLVEESGEGCTHRNGAPMLCGAYPPAIGDTLSVGAGNSCTIRFHDSESNERFHLRLFPGTSLEAVSVSPNLEWEVAEGKALLRHIAGVPVSPRRVRLRKGKIQMITAATAYCVEPDHDDALKLWVLEGTVDSHVDDVFNAAYGAQIGVRIDQNGAAVPMVVAPGEWLNLSNAIPAESDCC